MDKLKSRKLWVTIVTAVVMVGNEAFGWGIDTDKALLVVIPVIAYVLGQSWVDAKEKENAPWPMEPTAGIEQAVAQLNDINHDYVNGKTTRDYASQQLAQWKLSWPQYAFMAYAGPLTTADVVPTTPTP